MMNDERYVRKGYKIWDTYSDREVQELNYRSQSDYMCEVLNKKESRINTLVKENENLRKQVESSETTSNATSDYNAFLESKITTLEKENKELKKENQRVYGIIEDGGVLLTEKQLLDVIGEDKCDMFFREQTTISALKEENKQLHYQIIELQDKLGMSEKVIDDG